MSSSCSAKSSYSPVALRWIAVGALGALEVVAFTQYFDAYALETHGMPPLELIKRTEGLLGLAAVVAAIYAMAVFAKRRVLLDASGMQHRLGGRQFAFAGHIALVVLAAALAHAIFVRPVHRGIF